MHHVVLVKIVDGVQDLSYGHRGVFLGISALLTNPVEKLSASGQLCDDIVLVLLGHSQQLLVPKQLPTCE